MNISKRKRTENIGIRLTPEEKEAIKLAAQRCGLNLTAYIVVAALQKAQEKYV